MRPIRIGRIVAILILLWSITVIMASAQNVSGETDYIVGCAACHGRSGKGNGPVASELKTAPPDLTLLAKKNDGAFPARIVEQTIDGRKSLRAHGSSEMPVWGDIFSRLQPDKAQARIRNIVRYIKSIQVY